MQKWLSTWFPNFNRTNFHWSLFFILFQFSILLYQLFSFLILYSFWLGSTIRPSSRIFSYIYGFGNLYQAGSRALWLLIAKTNRNTIYFLHPRALGTLHAQLDFGALVAFGAFDAFVPFSEGASVALVPFSDGALVAFNFLSTPPSAVISMSTTSTSSSLSSRIFGDLVVFGDSVLSQ